MIDEKLFRLTNVFLAFLHIFLCYIPTHLIYKLVMLSVSKVDTSLLTIQFADRSRPGPHHVIRNLTLHRYTGNSKHLYLRKARIIMQNNFIKILLKSPVLPFYFPFKKTFHLTIINNHIYILSLLFKTKILP